jgi:2'-5' RNA ligase
VHKTTDNQAGKYFVAILVDEPAKSQINEIRKLYRPAAIERLDPHVTIIPPIILDNDYLIKIKERVAIAYSKSAFPIKATATGISVFSKHHSALFLKVATENPEHLARLYDDLKEFNPEKDRVFVPHITLFREKSFKNRNDIMQTFSDIRLNVTFSTISILNFRQNRWERYYSPDI